ncbi:soluble starch synthase [Coccomyxa subellipsoidea C-169]|uniref:starch synthase n=1 Tax=Coccomyxa subellipsoidea (strain C-169) TaxID=574566 RepID=I0YI05_COCSC|nr:soluble starch synthase [Coccomyxa subellipsoidea C-169]EIE18024.1 soluble starch synthase [Coccomyxa subellipsoidea C-169]|eukprot:XP_005642568.1 soluble starch synthase [Coccomyxa subellipsoidea C-169]
MHFLADRPRRCVQVRFDLVDEEAVSGDSAAASASADAAAQQPAGRSVTTAPAPKEVTLEVIEGGISWPQPQEEAFWERPPRSEAELWHAGASSSGPVVRDQRSLHVVHMTAEMAPIAKVGGLGDVVTGLARACLSRGHNLEVMLPFYESLPEDQIEGLQHDRDFDCPKGRVWDGKMQPGSLRTSVFRGKIDGIPVLLLRPDWGACNIFRGGRIYGGSYNEVEAYLYFSRACLEFLKISGRQPEIIHAHEWQLSAVPMLYWDVYHASGLSRPRVMLTIHNMDNSGECRQDEFAYTGMPGEAFATVDKALDERTIGHNPERLCLMKGGIIYSNAVTTVSPTYAREALEGGAAGWLRSTLAKPDVRGKFKGLLNGIDTALWDPATDPLIPAPYTPERMEGKALCKRYLQQGLGLDVSFDKPIVACITRLVPQKGIHLIRHAVYRTAELGGQFLLLGSGHADGDFRAMAAQDFKDSPDVRLMVMYSEELAHLMYAAADMVLVPSLFEPCGLTQLVAMRYGAVPIVRSTGGLADTVTDVDDGRRSAEGNGYRFSGMDNASLNTALDRAMQTFRDDRERWTDLSRRNMRIDWSWENSARSYVDIYNQLASY